MKRSVAKNRSRPGHATPPRRRGGNPGVRPDVPRPRKRFGQHFLEAAWVAKLVDTLHATNADAFVEIGPGRGALTIPLAARAGRVIAIEIDRDLATLLVERQLP